MDGVTDEVLIARAYLNRVAEPACIPLWDLVRTIGPVESAARVRSGDVSAQVRAATVARADSTDPYLDLDVAARRGIRLVVPESDDWPHFAFSCFERPGALRAERFAMGDRRHEDYGEPIPPLALWVRGTGDLSTLATRSVSVVGARAATGYGEQVASELSYALARRGFVIVSGGAFGIDVTAHRAALASGGSTVVVTAGGPDSAYPSAHAGVFDRAAETGLVVSESPPGSAPQRRRFLTRNRIVAALGTGSLVVEASRRSGAMNTAGHACRLGRPLMVIPGPVTSTMSVGCHDLIRDESRAAILVTTVDDVLAVVGDLLDGEPRSSVAEASTDRIRYALDAVDSDARQVYDGFPTHGSTTVLELSRAAGVSPSLVMRSLPVLELAGLVEAVRDGFRRVSGPTGTRDLRDRSAQPGSLTVTRPVT